jgi:hypothetical protein
MPTTGGRPDIGLMPGWDVAYLLSMDSNIRPAVMTTGDVAGSWSIHYRDKVTGRPVSIIDYPYATIAYGYIGDTYNPKTKKYEEFPSCVSSCTTPLDYDNAHQPAMNFLPYVLTGDYYQLEELQFWTMFNLYKKNQRIVIMLKDLFRLGRFVLKHGI